jgi:hypothetical protein
MDSWLWIYKGHLASTWTGIKQGIDYIGGTDYTFWFIIGYSGWISWMWIYKGHLASTWTGIIYGIDYIEGTHYMFWFIIGYSGWIS